MNSEYLQLHKRNRDIEEELRRHRHMLTIDLRKWKKQQEFQRRRHLYFSLLDDDEDTTLTVGETLAALSSNVLAQKTVGVEAARELLAPIGSDGGLIDIGLLQHLLPSLLQHLNPSVPANLQVHIAWTLVEITDDSSAAIHAVVNAGGVPLLINMLTSVCEDMALPALRAVGNIVSGDDQQTDALIAAGALPRLDHLLAHKNHRLVKEAAAIVCNISTGTPYRVQMLIDAELFQSLRQVLISGDCLSQKEAAWAIMNTTSCATLRQIITILERYKLLRPYCDLLVSEDIYTVLVVEIGIANMFSLTTMSEETQMLRLMLIEAEALQKLELLYFHRNAQVYKKAAAIVKTYFREHDPYVNNDVNMEVDNDNMDDDGDEEMTVLYNGPFFPNLYKCEHGPSPF